MDMSTTNETTKLTITNIDITFDDCPFVPDGATNYEEQEIKRAWGSAIVSLDDAINRLVHIRERLVTGNAISPHNAVGNVAQGVSEVAARIGVLDATRKGSLHRQSLAERGDPS